MTATTALTTTCRICGSVGAHARHQAMELMHGTREAFGYIECGACGCVQIEAVPADLARHYRADYYSLAEDPALHYRSAPKNLLKRLFDQASLRLGTPARMPAIAALRRVPGLHSGSRIVDVGCGSGHLLFRLHNAGFRQLTGVDPFMPAPREPAPGLRLLKQELGDTPGLFDLVMLNHAFEHVVDPLDTLSQVMRRLAPGGLAMIRVPVADSEAWHEYGPHWFQLDAPRHLHLHTRKSMQVLAEAAGARIVASHCDSDANQFVISERYRLGLPMQPPPGEAAVFSPAQRSAWAARTRELNAQGRGDQAVFYLSHAQAQGSPKVT